jgi:hypothetical protein
MLSPQWVDHGFINNVYNPPKPPEPEPSTAPPSYHSESKVVRRPAEEVTHDPATNGVVPDTPTPTADASPEQQRPRVPDNDPAVEAVGPIKVAKAADEVCSFVRITSRLPCTLTTARTQIRSESGPRGTLSLSHHVTRLNPSFVQQIPIPKIAPQSRTLPLLQSTRKGVQRTFPCILPRVQ